MIEDDEFVLFVAEGVTIDEYDVRAPIASVVEHEVVKLVDTVKLVVVALICVGQETVELVVEEEADTTGKPPTLDELAVKLLALVKDELLELVIDVYGFDPPIGRVKLEGIEKVEVPEFEESEMTPIPSATIMIIAITTMAIVEIACLSERDGSIPD